MIKTDPIYFDNAATTPLDPAVLESMLPYFSGIYGNPSSIHEHGRAARAAIEKARKTISLLLNTSPSQIFFTSGGTEGDNALLRGAVLTNDIKSAITCKLEHHAVLHTLEYLEACGKIDLYYVETDDKGVIDIGSLEMFLKKHPNSLVSLMHGNNEIGNLNDINEIGALCRRYNAFFHSDTVQTIGHFPIDLKEIMADGIVASAHKFHGPKGTGFLYLREGRKINPLLYGGAQERNMRGGTENVAGIAGMSRALELAYANMQNDKRYILSIKDKMKSLLQESIEGIQFNGLSGENDKSLYTVLSVLFPKNEMAEMLLFNMDIHKISVSGGSACSSGSNIGSHVLSALYGSSDERATIRFSFSKFNTFSEVERTVSVLKQIFS